MGNNIKETAATSEEKAGQLFPMEFIAFTKQLRTIQKWIEAYKEHVAWSDLTAEHVREISDCMGNAAYHIGELASIEFQQNVYYKD